MIGASRAPSLLRRYVTLRLRALPLVSDLSSVRQPRCPAFRGRFDQPTASDAAVALRGGGAEYLQTSPIR
jgi:hypothetical protein